MSNAQKAQVRRYMRQEAWEHVDHETGECNATTLAEDAANFLNLYEGNDIPEWVFECAHEVAEQEDRDI